MHCPYLMYVLQGFMLVYDVTNEKSFDNIRSWISDIKKVVSNEIVIDS